MVRKTHDTGSDAESEAGGRTSASPLGGKIKESATQIWLAGLGAFAKAQEEGSKVFDALVEEGRSVQRRTQASAGEKFTEVSGRMASVASQISSRASGQLNKLENLFEERVARALDRLGSPSARDHDDLMARVERIERELGIRRGTRTTASRGRRTDDPAPPEEAPAPTRREPRDTD